MPVDPISALTRVGQAQDALADGLRARAGVPSEIVHVGFPTGGLEALLSEAQEAIWIDGDVAEGEWSQEWSTSGQGTGDGGVDVALDETFTLLVHFYVSKTAGTRTPATYTAARDRVLELLAELAGLLRSDFKLGGALEMCRATGGGWQEGLTDDQRSCFTTVRLECQAFLTTVDE